MATTAHPVTGRILYVDDDSDACELAATVLGARGFDVVTETDASAALDRAAEPELDAVVTDLRLDAALDGLQICQRILAVRPTLPVIVATGHASMDAAIGALRAGAYDFVAKPFDPELLVAALRRAVQSSRLRGEVRRLTEAASSTAGMGAILGDSAAMRRTFEAIARVATTDATALVTGESGTGKELVARALHEQSARASGPFVAINCAAVPATLLESELFGHARGAFTDAKAARRGLFLDANGGTLFLDEIGEMPIEMQVKLLRALQERTVRPVGGNQELAFDARIVAATQRDLEEEVAAGRFRADLYYRINVCAIAVPALRERDGDVALLAQRFTQHFAERHKKDVRGVTPEALARLVAYAWPGNVRELENCMERCVAMTATDTILASDLPERVRASAEATRIAFVPETADELIPMAELERRYVAHVLKLVGGNKSRAARILGFDRRTLYRKLERETRSDDAPETGTTEADRTVSDVAPRGDDDAPHVTVVDDDDDAREMLVLLLTGQGFRVTASTLADAAHVGDGVVVVSGSPGGADPSSLLGEGRPPVVWITGARAPARDGYADVLAKPARLDDLAATIHRVLEAPGRAKRG